MKLLLIDTHGHEERSPLSDEERGSHAAVVADAFQAAGLPLVGLAAFVQQQEAFAQLLSASKRPGETSQISCYFYSTSVLSVTWSYNRKTKLTLGILLNNSGSHDHDEIGEDLSNMHYLDQPALLGLLGVSYSLHHMDWWFASNRQRMWKIQESTGLFSWDPASGEPLHTGVCEETIDYGTVSKELSALFGQVNLLRLRVYVLQKFTAKMTTVHKRPLSKCVPKSGSAPPNHGGGIIDVEQALDVLAEQESIWLARIDSVANQITTMISAIYNVIAHKDTSFGLQLAQDSRALAVESRRDRSSMNTIAAVTMAFLPGTFVASFFAMPMFDWSAPAGDNLRKSSFWIYWAVTLP